MITLQVWNQLLLEQIWNLQRESKIHSSLELPIYIVKTLSVSSETSPSLEIFSVSQLNPLHDHHYDSLTHVFLTL
jgi:hypothetical protein